MILIPNIGYTECSRSITLLKNYPQNIVGSFWVMHDTLYTHEKKATSKDISWWTDFVLSKNSAQDILDAIDNGYFKGEHNNPLYLGFCILIIANTANPADFTYVIQHIRMIDMEAGELLKLMAKHHIKAHTEITTPSDFIDDRYGYDCTQYRELDSWTTQVWEDYCSYLLAVHGDDMVSSYWGKYSN